MLPDDKLLNVWVLAPTASMKQMSSVSHIDVEKYRSEKIMPATKAR
jgi:hypothetical protein